MLFIFTGEFNKYTPQDAYIFSSDQQGTPIPPPPATSEQVVDTAISGTLQGIVDTTDPLA